LNGNHFYLINLVRLVLSNLYATYVVQALRWSPGAQALLSGVFLNGSGGFAAIVITRALRTRVSRMSKSFSAESEAVSHQG
jgi:hypothetical protein